MEALKKIQNELVAPKSQYNAFGKYRFRSCEDILEALKPLLKKHDAILTLTDEVVVIGERYYVKAHATLTSGEQSITTIALAREAETKKGMDESQITGTASSYARKFALDGLFAIDDTKDADVLKPNGSVGSNGSEAITTSQKKTLADLISLKGVDVNTVCRAYGIKSLSDLPTSKFTEVRKRLEGKPDRENKENKENREDKTDDN